ncbi:hypothetical protein SADUNF_Sadunf11G0005100 [Salix dunnii]|uniref:Uncharacterized protein n=1 Tax=Salix dunnii TaxID=1413687 RepID=A0A835MNK4_9ROSI|nr:hypothetical protein SADUNF_Sadunf11G0005100 [Salix dunnii]
MFVARSWVMPLPSSQQKPLTETTLEYFGGSFDMFREQESNLDGETGDGTRIRLIVLYTRTKHMIVITALRWIVPFQVLAMSLPGRAVINNGEAFPIN